MPEIEKPTNLTHDLDFTFSGFEYLGTEVPAYDQDMKLFLAHTYRKKSKESIYQYFIIPDDEVQKSTHPRVFIQNILNALK